MGERRMSRSPGGSTAHGFLSSCRRHIDLQRVAAALCPGPRTGF
jgi:hypothetical protein